MANCQLSPSRSKIQVKYSKKLTPEELRLLLNSWEDEFDGDNWELIYWT